MQTQDIGLKHGRTFLAIEIQTQETILNMADPFSIFAAAAGVLDVATRASTGCVTSIRHSRTHPT